MISSTQVRMPVMVQTCNSRTGKADRRLPEALLESLAQSVSLRFTVSGSDRNTVHVDPCCTHTHSQRSGMVAHTYSPGIQKERVRSLPQV